MLPSLTTYSHPRYDKEKGKDGRVHIIAFSLHIPWRTDAAVQESADRREEEESPKALTLPDKRLPKKHE